MSPTIDNEQLAKAKAEELISTIPLMPEVEAIDVELYTDNTGDPSFQLLFHVRKGVTVDREFMPRFLKFSAAVQTKILHSDINRFPYTRIVQAA
jgi:hypothetical protein